MASCLMHISIAKKVNETLHLNEEEFYLGTIAPDISKQMGLPRRISHFQDTEDSLPDLNRFLRLYKEDLKNPFTLGYFLHLYADYIWSNQYTDPIFNSPIRMINGEEILMPVKHMKKILYGDYSTLNQTLIDHYNLDLSIFYNEVKTPNTKIREIPLSSLQVLVDKMGVILLETSRPKMYLFEEKEIFSYINEVANGFIKWYLNK